MDLHNKKILLIEDDKHVFALIKAMLKPYNVQIVMKADGKTTKSFFSKLMLSHLIIILISLTVIGLIFSYLVQNYYFGLKEWEATNNSRRIAEPPTYRRKYPGSRCYYNSNTTGEYDFYS